ncbi:metallophosphoesterase [Microvirga massiliensis]|uniref:metallophosphoesterase n=1 Tax=Microvirga massiliensis TaxID=1033741 RepID=UPI00062B458B|nr:metallophosphoesterase [Microvirga massiliensis]
MRSPEITREEEAALAALEPRLGRLHVRQRLGLEHDFEAQVFREGTHFFHVENWYSFHGLIRGSLRLTGLHRRGRRNALDIKVRTNEVPIRNLPPAFDGFTLLQLSDLHLDMNTRFLDALIERVRPLEYDICVLTGDYRARTYGKFGAVLDGLERLRPVIKTSAYAVLGNHDTIRLVPRMEAVGYQLLLNEWTKLVRDGEAIYLAGIDDAHYYRMENFHRAAHDIPGGAVSVLLSHTPEAYRHAAHAGFDLMLCGHTHGGQICLPGGVPVLTDADSPRKLARGPWSYHGMLGYTSVGAGTSLVDVRLNCPPEVTLHRLRRSASR